MDLNNPSTPDTNVGQGGTPPANNAGQGNMPTPGSSVPGQGAQGVNQGGNGSSDALFEQHTRNFNQKITELAQVNSDLRKRQESYESQQAATREALAKAFGFGQEEQQADILTQIVNNEGFLAELIQKETLKHIDPIRQELDQRRAGEYLQTQVNQKDQIKAQLASYLPPELIEQVCDLTSSVDPSVIAIQQKLQNPVISPSEKARLHQELNSEVAKSIQRAGGVEALIYRNLGQVFANNFETVMQSGAKMVRQRQMPGMRANNGGGSYTGGASMAGSQYGGSSGYSSESIFV